MASHANSQTAAARNPLHQILAAASKSPFWSPSPFGPESRIVQGAIHTQDGRCHMARLSCDNRRHLFDLRVRAWTNGSPMPLLYEELLRAHAQTKHTRAICRVNENCVEFAATASYCPSCGPNVQSVRRVFRDLRSYLSAIPWDSIQRSH